MNEKIFLFGTGAISNHYTKILTQLSIEIYGYIDNNIQRRGEFFWEKKVYGPDILNEVEDSLVAIACSDIRGVTAQLSQMGMKSRIVSLEHIIRRAVQNLKIEIKNERDFAFKTNDEQTVIIDNLGGKWGGAEDWAHKITFSLLKRGYTVAIIENTVSNCEKRLKENTTQVDKKGKGTYEIYLELVEFLMQRKPFVLFNIWSTEVLWAASYVKKRYPEEVKIICSVLNDNYGLYQRHCEWDDCIDFYFCISSRIKNNLMDLFGISQSRIYDRVPFIENINCTEREYHIDRQKPLRIGYPCRLTRVQKRADLLPRLIANLERRKVNYVLNIAGEGDYENEIVTYVKVNHLDKKVNFYGKLSREDLIDFLGKQDIYVNFSEYEGTSLTMLEAMKKGCVPIVTDVSGVDDFIENGKNGLVSSVGDIENIADHILFLDRNRNELKEYGRKCAAIVQHKCDLDAYMDFIEKLINL